MSADAEPGHGTEPRSRPAAMVILCERDPAFKADVFSVVHSLGWTPLDIRLTSQHLAPGGHDTVAARVRALNDQAELYLVLLSGDDAIFEAQGSWFARPALQPRQNVILEAGAAFVRHPERTFFLTVGEPKHPSDLDGLVFLRYNDARGSREDIRDTIRGAGIAVREEDFDPHWRSDGAMERWRWRQSGTRARGPLLSVAAAATIAAAAAALAFIAARLTAPTTPVPQPSAVVTAPPSLGSVAATTAAVPDKDQPNCFVTDGGRDDSSGVRRTMHYCVDFVLLEFDQPSAAPVFSPTALPK